MEIPFCSPGMEMLIAPLLEGANSDPIPPDNMRPFQQCTPAKGKVEVKLPWATSGHCLPCLWPKLDFNGATGSTACGKHSPRKAFLSPGDGHT